MTEPVASCREVVTGMLRRRFRWRCCDEELMCHQRSGATRAAELLERFGGALLADDVGLGKSYTAAAVARHYLSRGLPVELLVPASLVPQWARLVSDLGLRVALTTHDALRGRGAVPGEQDGLVIVDEAHRFRHPATQRHRALALAAVGRRVLLVTATPLCNRPSDLLEILAIAFPDDVLKLDGVPSLEAAFAARDDCAIRRIVEELVIRRTCASVIQELELPGLRRSVIRYPLADRETLFAVIEKLRFPIIASSAAERRLLRGILWRRYESSPAALIDSLRRQRRFFRRARESLLGGARLTKTEYRALFGDHGDDQPFQELLFREFWTGPAGDAGAELGPVDEELHLVESAIAAASRVPDSKAELFDSLLDARAGETMLVFTSAIATARQLFAACSVRHKTALVTSAVSWIGSRRCAGAEEAFDVFRSGGVRILVSTDLTAEGLNLQAAGTVVHYDIPWNPIRLDQRNGRARRIGQERSLVDAVYFVPERASDRSGILAVVARKNRRRRAILGSRGDCCVSSAEVTRWLDCASSFGPAVSDGAAGAAEGRPGALALVTNGTVERLFCGSGRGLTDDWEGLDEFLTLRSEDRVAPSATLADHAAIEADVSAIMEARRLLPSRVPSGAPQIALVARLAARKISRAVLEELLLVRYRAGVEILIGQTAGGNPDDARLRWLEELLAREREICGDTRGEFRVIASVTWREPVTKEG